MLSGNGKIACLFFRLRISHALDGRKPLSFGIRRHLLQCPACRRFHGASVSLLEAPWEAHAGEDRSGGVSLAERVWTGIVQERTPAPALKLPVWKTRWAAALAAGLALVLLLGSLYRIPTRESGSSRAGTADAENIGFEQAMRLMNFQLARIHKITLGACIDEPLKVEVQRLSKDAESVQRFFLALLPPHSMLKDP